MSTTEKSLDSLSDSYTTARISDLEDSDAGSIPIYGIYDSEMTIFLETVIDGDEVYLSIDKSVTKSDLYESQVYHLYDVTSDVEGSFKRSIDVQVDLEKRAVKFGSMDDYAVSITNSIPDSLAKCDRFSEVFPEEFHLFNSYLSIDNPLKDGWKCEIVMLFHLEVNNLLFKSLQGRMKLSLSILFQRMLILSPMTHHG